MKRRKILTAGPLLVVLITAASLYIPFPKRMLNPEPVVSLRILDRNGELLREVLSDEGGRCTWVSREMISPLLLKATVAAEDRSFFYHPGVNIFSILRALSQNITQKRIVSGASTITQQLVRNLFHHKRTLPAKLLEAWNALRLEKAATKDEILIQYINRISYGNQAYGIEAASQLYFSKSSSDLSLAEGAFLAGLPRAPSLLNPFKSPEGALKRQRSILHLMHRKGDISREALNRALSQPLRLTSSSDKFRAPHFCDYILGGLSPLDKSRIKTIHSTLDYSIQTKVERLTRNHIDALSDKNISNAAVVVLDNRTDAVLAMVGSKDFFDDSIQGQVNGALALRQPGSALKPFTYGLAIEQGKTASTLIDDRQMNFRTPTGSYRPMNYDRSFHGPVRLRTALACSYNIPAVSLLNSIGPDFLYRRLKECGFSSLAQPPSYYGVGLTLGNAEVSLMELSQSYAALSRGGIFRSSRLIDSVYPDKEAPPSRQTARRIFSREAAWLVTHILSDNDARIPAFGYNSPLHMPFPCAAKTGTTKDYRDNWTVGWTNHFTVGVWVGNFNGEPMHNVSGISGCGPLFRDIMLFLESEDPSGGFERPASVIKASVCPESGLSASEDCPGTMDEYFIQGTEPQALCPIHGKEQGAGALQQQLVVGSSAGGPSLRVLFPASGDIFKVDPVLRRDYQTILLKASVPPALNIGRVSWWVDDRLVGETGPPYEFPWKIEPGSFTVKITAMNQDTSYESRTVSFSVLM